MEGVGVGITPAQVTTPRGTRISTPHNAFERVERAAGRSYRRERSPTDGGSKDGGDRSRSDRSHSDRSHSDRSYEPENAPENQHLIVVTKGTSPNKL